MYVCSPLLWEGPTKHQGLQELKLLTYILQHLLPITKLKYKPTLFLENECSIILWGFLTTQPDLIVVGSGSFVPPCSSLKFQLVVHWPVVSRQDKTRQDKTRQDKTRLYFTFHTIDAWYWGPLLTVVNGILVTIAEADLGEGPGGPLSPLPFWEKLWSVF